MSFQIREATIDDIDALCSLTKELKGSSISYEDMNNRLQFVQMSPFDFFICLRGRRSYIWITWISYT